MGNPKKEGFIGSKYSLQDSCFRTFLPLAARAGSGLRALGGDLSPLSLWSVY